MKIKLLFVFLIICLSASSQRDTLSVLRYKIMAGDFEALKNIGYFLDSKKKIVDMLGHHYLENTEGNVARRVLRENCLFTESELKFDSALTTKKFHSFLATNKVIYSEETGAYLVTPFEARKTEYELRRMDQAEFDSLRKLLSSQPYPSWIFENNIDYYIGLRDPRCLTRIASSFLKARSMWNIYNFNDEEYINYLKYLTGLEFGVPTDKGKISFIYKYSSTEARMNLLTYFTTYINHYIWSETDKFFLNRGVIIKDKPKELVLFDMLKSENDSTAITAFKQLMEADPRKVWDIADEYERNNVDANYAIPTFPFRFLKQGSALTEYCIENDITYKASGPLAVQLDSLLKQLSFAERYKLENRIVNSLSPDQVTAVEYFGLINEKDFSSTYSIGRILDKFYSKNWSAIISNENHLRTYLKKSALFDRLGIIGICNKYVRKFENNSPAVLIMVQSVTNKTTDPDIKEQSSIILDAYKTIVKPIIPKITAHESSRDYTIPDVRASYKKILLSKAKIDDKKREVEKLFGKISYKQIGEVLALAEKDTLLDNYRKYSFLESDFGFALDGYDSLTIARFRQEYSKLSEKEMYRNNLVESGTDIFSSNGEPDYNKIYEVLKYDIVDAFAGGGGGRRDDNVYAVIKLLEFQFNTRLGFPKKLCNSQGTWACSCEDQMKYWMQFLEEKKLVAVNTAEPRSISYND